MKSIILAMLILIPNLSFAIGRTGLSVRDLDLDDAAIRATYNEFLSEIQTLVFNEKIADFYFRVEDKKLSGCVEFVGYMDTIIRTMPRLIQKYPSLSLGHEITCRNGG